MAIKQVAPGITQFDDVEDFFAAEEKARVEADARVQPYQAAVKVGDFVVRAACGMIIYGEVLDPCKSEEPEEGLSPEDLEEIRAEMEVERQSWAQPEMKNYRFPGATRRRARRGKLETSTCRQSSASSPRWPSRRHSGRDGPCGQSSSRLRPT